MTIAGLIIHYALYIYMYLLIARMVLSWVTVLKPDWSPKGPVLVIANLVYDVTDPPLKFFGKFIKPIRVGDFALDLSFMVVFIVVVIAMRVNAMVFF